MKLARHCLSVSEAIALIQPGNRVFVQGGAGTPMRLLEQIRVENSRLRDLELIHLHTEGKAEEASPSLRENLKTTNLFVGGNFRSQLDYHRVDYLPCFLSEIPQLFRSRRRPLDVALIHVSPPDRHGFCSLGVSVDICLAAIESAKTVIAQVNPRMPRVHGDGIISMSQIDAWIDSEDSIPEHLPCPLSPEEIKIGEHIASLVEDEATLQAGIGSIPDAALRALTGHKNLGLHTEMWSDGALVLLEKGVITNTKKKIHPGKSVSGFVMGSQRLYDFIDDNPSVVQLDISYVNDPSVIARNPKVTAINSAVEIDLTGQVCADSIGHKIISGVGGQMDFMRGASLSKGGKPILALTSRTQKGHPRLVAELKPGAGVVTTRAHVHFVVTEYGVVDLYGKTLGERAKALINIAHPDDRERLAREWHNHHST